MIPKTYTVGDVFTYTAQPHNGSHHDTPHEICIVATLNPPERPILRAGAVTGIHDATSQPCGCVFDVHNGDGWVCGQTDEIAPLCTADHFPNVPDDVELVYMRHYTEDSPGCSPVILTGDFTWYTAQEWFEKIHGSLDGEAQQVLTVYVPDKLPDGSENVDIQAWLNSRGYGEFTAVE